MLKTMIRVFLLLSIFLFTTGCPTTGNMITYFSSGTRYATHELKGNERGNLLLLSAKKGLEDDLIYKNYSSLTAIALRASIKASSRRGSALISQEFTKTDKIEVRTYFSSSDSNTKVIAEMLAAVVLDVLKSGTMDIPDQFFGLLRGGSNIRQAESLPKLVSGDVDISSYTVDISGPLGDEDRRFLRFPSEDAWTLPYTTRASFFDADNSQAHDERIVRGESFAELPVNAIDIVYVVDNAARQKITKPVQK